MRSSSGVSLVEVLVGLAVSASVMTGIGGYLRATARKSNELASRDAATRELDALAQRIAKDFQRHTKTSAGIELDDTSSAFNSPATPKCSDLRIRQTILGVGGAPNTIQKVEYRTACTGDAFPDSFAPTSVHQELATSCQNAPRVTRTVWPNEVDTGTSSAIASPSEALKSMAACFRADALPHFARVTAELSVTYAASETDWKTMRKSIDLLVNEMGSDIEILPPNSF